MSAQQFVYFCLILNPQNNRYRQIERHYMSKSLLQQRAIAVIVTTLVATKSNAAAGRHND